MKFAVLDFETTGMSSDKDEIIQVGLAVIDDAGSVCASYTSFVKPLRTIPVEITRLTGITNQDVSEAPALDEMLSQLVPLLDDAILVGHNVNFDASFLQAALDQSGYLPYAGRMLDTVELSQIVFPSMSSYALGSLTQALGITHSQAHQADSDALATAELLMHIITKLRTMPMFTLQRLNSQFDPDRSDTGWLFAQVLSWRDTQPILSEDEYHHFRQFALKVNDWGEDSTSKNNDAAQTLQVLSEMSFDEYVEAIHHNLQQLLPGYEAREGQNIMIQEVMSALQNDSHLLVEAGTGTGKSLGYLLPALYYGLKHNEKIVVSTHTIQLQEQLRQRDLPLLQEMLPVPFKAAVFKGRNNYLCLRKFEGRQSIPDHALNRDDAVLRAGMTVWLSETLRGDIEELNIGSRNKEEWDHVASDTASCLNRVCPWFRKCFYHRARNEASKADLVITNHALLFTDLRADHRLLPAYDRLIVDEAHHLEDVASHHLGQRTGHTSLSIPLQRLWKDARTGLVPQLLSSISASGSDEGTAWVERVELAIPKVHQIRESWERWMDASFQLLSSQAVTDETGNLTYRIKPDQLPSQWESYCVDGNNVIQHLSDLIRPLEKLLVEIKEEVEELTMQGMLTDLSGILNELSGVRSDLQSFVSLGRPEFVYWIEGHSQFKARSVWLLGVPIDVSGLLKEGVFDRKESVIMTSATLTVDKSFKYVTDQLGLDSAERDGKLKTAMLPSPFKYREQALVLIPRDFPTIRGRDGDAAFHQALIDSLAEVATTVGGRMLVLFTSHRMLRAVYEPLKEKLDEVGIQVLGQGVDGGSRSRLTQQFMAQPASVLLGTSSFWEGIDLPGDALTCLAIVRLPFQPPNHPVAEAKSEKLQAENKSPFMKLSLPQAVIKFKQGFGRLVRTTTDRGIVILYDTRVIDTNYGKYFLYSLPGPKMEHLPTARMPARIKEWFTPTVVEVIEEVQT
ncbi:MAG: ATP-dependent DNA helicase DinG [Candidatus Cohnella colombiensis]|uniref:3'-5' exonuclease DinG n=1 Tax=Candidatus Cohnella colombiensis TaxID=3121368 RepID=A0AA95JGU4_9BACL|nr:MAG: ATP-dependent DNA helicase DinG [Cohnella sp.]